jgi:hypothetical protein
VWIAPSASPDPGRHGVDAFDGARLAARRQALGWSQVRLAPTPRSFSRRCAPARSRAGHLTAVPTRAASRPGTPVRGALLETFPKVVDSVTDGFDAVAIDHPIEARRSGVSVGGRPACRQSPWNRPFTRRNPMSKIPVRPGARRSRARLFLGGVFAVALVVTAAILPGVAHADTTVTTNQIGTNNGYFYVYQKDGPGTATLILGAGGRYTLQWSGVNSLVAGKGWSTGGRRTVSYHSTFNTTGNAYVGINGWTTNPLVEYNIVENWGTYRPYGTFMGTVTTDGGVYEVFRTLRINQLSIVGIATYYEYWSVRTAKRTAGAITTGNHFDAWANHGMNLGATHSYMILATTAYQSSGSADVTIVSPACC